MKAGALLAAGSLALCGWAFAQEPAPAKSFSVPGHGSLALKVPAGWQTVDRSTSDPPSLSLRLGPSSGNAFKVLVTSVWIDPGKRKKESESLKERVQRTANNLLKQAVETEAKVLDLRGAEGRGYYFSLTARGSSTGPDDYKYMTQGTVEIGQLTTIFTIFMREPDSIVREQALRMFGEAEHSKTEVPATLMPDTSERLRIVERGGFYELSVPVSRLVMTLPREGLTQVPIGTHPRYFQFTGSVIVSGWFEPARGYKGVAEFWKSETEGWKRRGLPDPVNVAFTKEGNWEVVIYDMPSPLGNVPNLRAHWVQAGTWIDIHMSVLAGSGAEGRNRMLEALRKIEVRERQ